jgi:hypothetical protein
MLHLLPDGDRRYRLVDGDGREVGWIRGRAVRFLGFLSEEEMVTAATRAWKALQAVLADAVDRAADGSLTRQLRLVHDGAYEWISDGTIPMARVFRSRSPGDSSMAIELVMPSYADEQLAKSAAMAIASALGQTAPATSV